MPAALNVQPLKKQALKPLAEHYTRSQKVPPKQVDPTRSNLNAYWPDDASGCLAAMEALADYGKGGRHPDGTKIRQDARYGAAAIFTLPVELKGRGDKVAAEWLTATIHFAMQEMPGKMAAFAVHLDETTPHLHVCYDTRDETGKLAYKKMFGSRARLKSIQTAYSKKLEPLGVRPSTDEEKLQRRGSYTTGIHGWRAGRAVRAAQALKMSIERKAQEVAAQARMVKERLARAVETEDRAKARAERWADWAREWSVLAEQRWKRKPPIAPPTTEELLSGKPIKRRRKGGGGPSGP